jgi:agmatinase
VAGLVDVYGKGKVGVVHFDAHADQAPVGFGHLITHGNPVRQLVDAGLVEGKNIIQVGLRGPNSTDMNGVKWNRENKLRYHMMAEVERRGWQAVMKDVLKEAMEGAEYLFISFDIDVVDPAFIPGTSTPEPGGLYMREVMPLMRGLCTHPKLVGVEIVELRPDSDPGYTTMLNTKAILRKCLEGITLRKSGITDPLYLHPETVDDGQG